MVLNSSDLISNHFMDSRCPAEISPNALLDILIYPTFAILRTEYDMV